MPVPYQAIPKVTLEQWAAFKAVIDEGSYARAAERLNKSQSTISYAISRLNELLPTPAMVIEGRKAVLTPAGSTLYRYATNLLDQAYATEQAAQFLAGGWESSLTLVTDVLTPVTPVLSALQALAELNPLTRVKVVETALSGTDEAVLNHECDLAVMVRVPPGLLGHPLGQVRMLACVDRKHPLASKTLISEQELKQYRQIVVRDSGTRRQQDAGWLGSEQRWTVSHFAASMDIVRAGLGFAFLPEHRIAALLQSGELVQLRLEMGAARLIGISLVISRPGHAGPATTALADALKLAFAKERRWQADEKA